MADHDASRAEGLPPSIARILGSTPAPATEVEIAALRRLLRIAQSDTGQSRRCANFLLAWWNAGTCGGFDLTDLWAVDTEIAQDMVAVFAMVSRLHNYPDPWTRAEFEALVHEWRPHLIQKDD